MIIPLILPMMITPTDPSVDDHKLVFFISLLVAFKGAKTTNYGLVNKYDVLPAGRMQVDYVMHDMSLNLSLDHVSNRSNDQYGALRLPP